MIDHSEGNKLNSTLLSDEIVETQVFNGAYFQIFDEVCLDFVMQNGLSSCFGFLVRFPKAGVEPDGFSKGGLVDWVVNVFKNNVGSDDQKSLDGSVVESSIKTEEIDCLFALFFNSCSNYFVNPRSNLSLNEVKGLLELFTGW